MSLNPLRVLAFMVCVVVLLAMYAVILIEDALHAAYHQHKQRQQNAAS